MHVDLITTTKGSPKVIHGTENGKRTACGINLSKPENIGKYTGAGVMTDVIQMTCEKCKMVIAKHLIKESNKEMAAQLKEEQRMLKRERSASKHNHGAVPAPIPNPQQNGEYIPPSMRKSMQQPQEPIAAPPPPAPAPISIPAPASVPSTAAATAEDALSRFNIPVPQQQAAPAPQIPASPQIPANDVLAQFAIPGSAPAMQPPVPPMTQPTPVPANDVLAQFAIPGSAPAMQPPVPPMPQPTPVPADDVLAQFAIPGSAPSMQPPVPPVPQPAPVPADDVLAQFAIPGSAPSMQPPVPPMPQSAPVPADDVLAQFAIPGSAPSMQPPVPPKPQPAPVPADDVLAQFAVPNPMQSGAPAENAEDILAQFSVPSVAPVQSAPVPGTPVITSPEDILAQFSGNQPSAAPVLDDIPSIDAEIDELKTHAANAFARPEHPVDVTPIPTVEPVIPPQPAADLVSQALDDLLLMPSGSNAPQGNQPAAPVLDDLSVIPPITNVPTAPQPGIPAMQSPFAVPTEIPSLDVPPAPPAPPIPDMPVPPSQQPQQQAPAMNVPIAPQPAQPVHNALFSVPTKPKKQEPNTPTPLFVGYSADGRQVFQKFDTLGNPIPITEPVYSAPPEQPKYSGVQSSQSMNQSGANVPVLDMDELIAKMGISTASKKKVQDTGKAINYTEYKMPAKKQQKKRPSAATPPPSAMPDISSAPISAAEAKRRKKVDKINKEFEKQLRSRGIDPKTGGMIVDKK
ncbi:MAG: hypothetical protein K5705_06370 [Oscillospiraceae bacterium]|nr:hypothetical protein [Oscillospiraceae bacterium]